ncbi:MAG: Nif3-like dinuclear metal center hexameric protein [Anaerolineae bacterium]|nr:Nif3-like dinuclear metal center hexameric protein [Anaerolineae bacterium]
MKRNDLIDYLNKYLRVEEIEDKSQNGLQVEGPDEVRRVAFAVDACQASFERAVAEEAQLLIVHHGLFWSEPLRLIGPHFRRVKTLIEGRCGLYAVHLPLDMHPVVGNNAEMVRLLKLEERRPFGVYHGLEIGFAGRLDSPLDISMLIGRLVEALDRPPLRVLDHGSEEIEDVGCVSGGAASMMDQAAEAELDAFITGETDHASFHEVAERRLNVLFAGHYATETLGVKALARHIEEQFDLDTMFFDIPTGM